MKKIIKLFSILIIILCANFSFAKNIQKATFAGGCFWCMESPFEKQKGVQSVISGFAGGIKKNPTYKEVASGQTKHVEAVQITFDAEKISFKKLLELYWVNVDPTDNGGQFVDRGPQYRPVIYTHDEVQLKLAKASKERVIKTKKFKAKVNLEITKYTTFYPAEEYHQDYYKKNPVRYWYYRRGSGRDKKLKQLWGEPNVKKQKKSLIKIPTFEVISLILSSPSAHAKSKFYTGFFSSIAIKSYDVVAYFKANKAIKGSEKFEHIYGGVTWRFSNKENLESFVSKPEDYLPQYGGYCAYAVSQNSTASVDPKLFTIHEGKLYLNYNQKINETWTKNKTDFIKKADQFWPKIKNEL